MRHDHLVDRVAEAVLYEGYLLYPYRPTAMKNQQRWTFGGVYPQRYSEASGGDDPWLMQTQCLIVGGEDGSVDITVRFLHVLDRTVAERTEGDDVSSPKVVERLHAADRVYRPGEEAMEREIRCEDAPLCLRHLAASERHVPIDIPAGRTEEPVVDAEGTVVGALMREWQALHGDVAIRADPVRSQVDDGREQTYRLTVRIVNTTPWSGEAGDSMSRSAIVRRAMISTHTILRLNGGEFVSLLETPPEHREQAEACENVKTWPVLVGEHGERQTVLSSPIILYDYPEISPQSRGNLYDATEIDELLTLSVMTLTDEEKQELRESDPRAREILERTESLSPDEIMGMHGIVRGLQVMRGDEP